MSERKSRFFCAAAVLTAAFFSFSCSGGQVAKEITLEPSIERILEEFEASKEYAPLVKFIKKHRARIEFEENSPGNCVKYDFSRGRITIPRKYRESELFLKLETLKALYIWKMHLTYKLEEYLEEEEVLASLQQMHYILGSVDNLTNKTFESDKRIKQKFTKEFCAYAILNTQMMVNIVNLRCQVMDTECGFPLETVATQRAWSQKVKESMQNEKFFDLMYEKDLLKVKRGLMKMAEATRNNAMLRSKPLYEIYRDQRSYYDISLDKLDKFEKFFKSEMENDKAWRQKHFEEIENARYEFPSCAE